MTTIPTDAIPDPRTGASRTLPSRARVVVIGGGIIGTSVAYHLAHLGLDVVLLERDRLTSGTTWHAAGLMVTFGSMSETSTSMRQYTRDLYTRLEAETGLATGFKPVGFIEVATPGGWKSTGGCRRSTASAGSTCTRSHPRRSRSCSRSPTPTTSGRLLRARRRPGQSG